MWDLFTSCPAACVDPGGAVRSTGPRPLALLPSSFYPLHRGHTGLAATVAARLGTSDPHVFRDESDGYHATGDPVAQNLVLHGIQYLTDPRKWPAGSKLVTWVKLDVRRELGRGGLREAPR